MDIHAQTTIHYPKTDRTSGATCDTGRPSSSETIQRMDNVAIVVDDLDAAIEFFAELGMEMEGKGQIAPRFRRSATRRLRRTMVREDPGPSRSAVVTGWPLRSDWLCSSWSTPMPL